MDAAVPRGVQPALILTRRQKRYISFFDGCRTLRWRITTAAHARRL